MHNFGSLWYFYWDSHMKAACQLIVKAMLQGNEEKKDVGRILEFFKTTDGENYFRVQWFYRVEDTVSVWIFFIYYLKYGLVMDAIHLTNHSLLFLSVSQVIKEVGNFHDKRRLFYSSIMNDNLIDCIILKVNVTQISPRV